MPFPIVIIILIGGGWRLEGSDFLILGQFQIWAIHITDHAKVSDQRIDHD